MTTTFQEHEERKAKSFKMMLWFAMISMAMVFAGLTSAYVVSKSRPDWLTDFELPVAFIWSTIIVIISSLTFYLAQKSAKNAQPKTTTMYLYATLVLGVLFVLSQFQGFAQVVQNGYFFTGSESNVTTSFLYIVVLVHLAHLFGGLIALLVIIYKNHLQKYTAQDYLGIELGAMFWHFLDFLWVYLFLFFYFYK
jgi:cytochrome c oxidase subunit III